MKTILVDDEAWALEQLEMEIAGMEGVNLVGRFQNPRKALEYAESNSVEFALLDVEMPVLNGMDLGRRLKELHPEIVVIYLTGYDSYLREAILSVGADYYILKPYTHKDIEQAFLRARLLAKRQKKRVFFRTFGTFEMLVDGSVLGFSNARAKELLALCVHRQGGNVSMGEAISFLWPDRPYDQNVKSLYRKAVIYLRKTFAEHQAGGIFITTRGYCRIDVEAVECDYYDYLQGKNREDFRGEYMQEYSWAEETVAMLVNEFYTSLGGE